MFSLMAFSDTNVVSFIEEKIYKKGIGHFIFLTKLRYLFG